MEQHDLFDHLFLELVKFARHKELELDLMQLWNCARHLSRTWREVEAVSQSRSENHGDDFLTRRECADFLRVSLPTFDRYVREGGLPGVPKNLLARRRKHAIFSRAEVEAWARSHLSRTDQRNSK